MLKTMSPLLRQCQKLLITENININSFRFLFYQSNTLWSGTIRNSKCVTTESCCAAEGNIKESKKLFTPGPLGISSATKEAMLRDLGSRDSQFMETVKLIRHELLNIAGVSPNDFAAILLQGSGTYGIESVLQTTTNKNGKLLILSNGSYGKRMDVIIDRAGLSGTHLSFPETEQVHLDVVEDHLKSHPDFYTSVAVVHCETSTGIVNDIEKLGKLVRKYCKNAVYIVDAMSSFGAIPLDFESANIDYLITSANKCLEGVPGFAVVIARTNHLLSCKGQCRSLSLDLVDQYEGLEKTGQFRFTPPTHAILAFQQALFELRTEGGVAGRAKRYLANCQTLRDGMSRFGFQRLIRSDIEGYIITSYLIPKNPNFVFEEFYQRLNNLNQVIYPGKVTEIDTFRIGNIGHLFPNDMIQLLLCIEKVCKEMKINFPIVE